MLIRNYQTESCGALTLCLVAYAATITGCDSGAPWCRANRLRMRCAWQGMETPRHQVQLLSNVTTRPGATLRVARR